MVFRLEGIYITAAEISDYEPEGRGSWHDDKERMPQLHVSAKSSPS